MIARIGICAALVAGVALLLGPALTRARIYLADELAVPVVAIGLVVLYVLVSLSLPRKGSRP